MKLSFSEERAPLVEWSDGSVRVGKTGVKLEIVIEDYQLGLSPEEIVESHPTLKLGDVYSVIGYYLHRKEEVDKTMREWEEAGEKLKKWADAQPGQAEAIRHFRERARKTGHSL